MRGGDDNLHGFGVVSALDGLVYEAVRAEKMSELLVKRLIYIDVADMNTMNISQ